MGTSGSGEERQTLTFIFQNEGKKKTGTAEAAEELGLLDLSLPLMVRILCSL